MLSRVILLFVALISPITSFGSDEFLAPEQAFPLSASRDGNGDVLLHFDVVPGYALYASRITVAAIGAGTERIVRVVKPKGVIHDDEFLGRQEQYRTNSVVRVVLNNPWEPLRLEVKSQGCADAGICYNPIRRVVNVP